MDPSEVDSSQDIRDGWDSWSYSERVEALDQLANETLDQYGYDDDVNVDTGDTGSVPGHYNYSDGSITLDPRLVEDPDPTHAIHVMNHETVHGMNDQDGIDDYSYNDDFDFEEGDIESLDKHGEIGDVARELDSDGSPPSSSGGSTGGGESGGTTEDPKSEDLEFEIDWAQGVWIDSVDESGNMSVDLMFSAPEGW
jgi:hypothetical protein